MSLIIGCVSQKGGVGKSTLCRLLAREFAAADWRVLIADTDNKQTTSTDWVSVRNDREIEPEVRAMPVRLGAAPDSAYDLVIYDGAPSSSKATLEIARLSRFVIIPTGVSLDDLQPSVLLAHELMQNGVSIPCFCFVLCRTGSEIEIADARAYLSQAGYHCIDGSIPERTAYRVAQNQGRALTETPYESLNERAAEVAQNIINLTTEM